MLSPIRDTPVSPLAQQPRLNGLGAAPVADGSPDRRPVPATPLSRHRLLCYERWERISRGHHQVLYAQAAEEVLIQQWRRARNLEKRIRLALARGAITQGDEMEQLRRQMLTRRGSFGGRPLLDHRLEPIADRGASSPRLCRLKSVDLLSPRSRAEQIELRIGELWLSLTLPADASVQLQLSLVQRALAQCGVEALHVDGQLQFAVPDVLWQKLDGHWWMRGQGQRLPAGELRGIKLLECHHWQDPRGWGLNDIDNLRQSLPKVQGVVAKLARMLKRMRSQLELASVGVLSGEGGLAAEEIPAQLDALGRLLAPQGFHRRLTSLMAQANTSRNQTQSLLY
ncbi:hypothetical protein FCL40_15120 [Ferrimonas sediminicola]|uniref:Uncharacterized protein n=1 Tax=Ferrimonas sediminicola TaxID=2569538 RepID=A0A4U1BB59_9GAMM|nr:hypothetical protein [Ferrimonas sediminicola]TKB47802.1 hypothetical protein FCL40_15120 [Ferrimonas sediminicola]